MITRKIKIRFRLTNSLCIPNYRIEIQDKYRDLLFNDYVDNLGCIYFNTKYLGLYRIIVYDCNLFRKCIPIFINRNNWRELSIILDDVIDNKNSITVKLTDQNYKDMPISKGEIILWEK